MAKKNPVKSKWTTLHVKQSEKEKIKRGAERLGLTQGQYVSRALTLAEQREEEPALPADEEFGLNDYFYLLALKNLGLL